MAFLDDLKDEITERGIVDQMLFDYIDQRIDEALSNRIMQSLAQIHEQLRDIVHEEISKARIVPRG